MFFASDNTSGVHPAVLAGMVAANTGYAPGYGADPVMARVTQTIRQLFEAPQAAVYLVATGTAANALSIATHCPPWGGVFCHSHAHIIEDECGAPDFFSGARMLGVAGDHGKIDPAALATALQTSGGSVHNTQRGMLSLTNVTEAGTVYSPAEIAALTALARDYGLPCHMDGARFANALAATGASPAALTWQAGIDVLSLGGTKNGLMAAEAVVMFDPARAAEFELRRKRGGHLFSKNRYLAAQFDAYLADGLWLTLAAHANAMAARLAAGLAALPDTGLIHPVDANILFVHWPKGTSGRLRAAGAAFYDHAFAGAEGARLVASWSTTEQDVDDFLAVLRG